jgi:two-component system sensor histidine kinase KdpD
MSRLELRRTIAPMSERIATALAIPRPARPSAGVGVLAVGSVVVATVVIAVLEQATAIPDASAVYLVAIVAVAIVGGTVPAIATALVAFLVYDVLFTEPRLSLAISDPAELLNLVLVLIVALAVGRLAALGRQRAAEAERRASEAIALFSISRLLATAETTTSVAAPIVGLLARDAALDRVWVGLDSGGREQVLADTGSGPFPAATIVMTLVRMPGDVPARWVRAHAATPRQVGSDRPPADGDVLRIKIETGGTVFGSLWAIRTVDGETPGQEATRLLALAADQIALGLRRDRLRQEATSAEVARRGDALKSALLDSVSHDLRTPLASIRATAGNLADPDVAMSSTEVREAAESIDGEAQRLDRFVRSVLDLSRIESGTLRPDLEMFEVQPLIERAVERLAPVLRDRPVSYEVTGTPPLIRVDEVLFDAIVSNVLENVADHTPPGTPVRVAIAAADAGRVRITIEDGGPGVAAGDIGSVFDKFQRAGARSERARRGMGIGLSIVRGMTDALGGVATAHPSTLGGLAIEIDLPAIPASSEPDAG